MYTCTRIIGIDAGHRIPTHGSKCKHLHGHRYSIEATCQAKELIEEGTQSGMVLDFGFLKDEMMRVIHDPCDHTMMLWIEDPLLAILSFNGTTSLEDLQRFVERKSWHLISQKQVGVLFVMAEIPTAEILAKLWFNNLAPEVTNRSGGKAELVSLKVWETPNCTAVYVP